ncbi:MAG: NADPH-dependent FMN reductase [Pseudomonadota bacterium]
MKVLMVSGTYNSGSKTHAVLMEAQEVCASYGIESEIAELCEYAIVSGQKDTRFDLHALTAKIDQSDAVIFATPNYQGSMSGLLKVAIDNIPEHGLKDKAIGLIAVSGGMGRMSQPISHLRDVVAALEGLAVSTAIACYSEDFEKDSNGSNKLVTPKLLARVKDQVDELYSYRELVKVEKEKGLS